MYKHGNIVFYIHAIYTSMHINREESCTSTGVVCCSAYSLLHLSGRKRLASGNTALSLLAVKEMNTTA